MKQEKPRRPQSIPIGAEISVADIETDMQIGVYMGCEWKNGDIGLHLGVAESTVRWRRDTYPHRDVIEKVAAWTRIGIAKYIESRIQDAEADIVERKKRLRSKGYRAIEKTLDSVVGEGKEEAIPEAIHLRAAEMALDRTEGKAVDRKAVLSLSETTVRHELDAGDLDEVLGEAARLNELRKQAFMLPPANVQDAEVVGH